jgi:hypothetical protein
LCWACFYDPKVRKRYPITSKFARRGVIDFYGSGKLPAPTHAMPGTSEKVEVLERRARLHQALWHPHDAPNFGDSV